MQHSSFMEGCKAVASISLSSRCQCYHGWCSLLVICSHLLRRNRTGGKEIMSTTEPPWLWRKLAHWSPVGAFWQREKNWLTNCLWLHFGRERKLVHQSPMAAFWRREKAGWLIAYGCILTERESWLTDYLWLHFDGERNSMWLKWENMWLKWEMWFCFDCL